MIIVDLKLYKDWNVYFFTLIEHDWCTDTNGL